jgi:hypothetical protein
VTDLREEAEDGFDTMDLNSESISSVIRESDILCEKHDEQRI